MRGHPWIYRSDVTATARCPPASCRCMIPAAASSGRRSTPPPPRSGSGCSSAPTAPVDAAWWRERLAASAAPPRGHRRHRLSAGARRGRRPSFAGRRPVRPLAGGPDPLGRPRDHARADRRGARRGCFEPDGILLRNDAAVRRREGLRTSGQRSPAATVPREIEVREGDGALPRRALGRPEDRRVPRSAPQPLLAGELARAGRPRARLLRLSRLLRRSPGRAAPQRCSRWT